MIIGIFAIDNSGGMGFRGRMPWPKNKDDMQWFKSTTYNQLVVMGRNTWDSPDMPTPLSGRTNVLVTNNFIDCEDIIQVHGDVCAILEVLETEFPTKDIYVIGGLNLLLQARPLLKTLYITHILGDYINDVAVNSTEFLNAYMHTNTQQLTGCHIETWVQTSPIEIE